MVEEDGNTSGRNERLRGQMGVRTSALRDGCTIGPPADNEYAVDPVGVDTMIPSDFAYQVYQLLRIDMWNTVHTTASVKC